MEVRPISDYARFIDANDVAMLGARKQTFWHVSCTHAHHFRCKIIPIYHRLYKVLGHSIIAREYPLLLAKSRERK